MIRGNCVYISFFLSRLDVYFEIDWGISSGVGSLMLDISCEMSWIISNFFFLKKKNTLDLISCVRKRFYVKRRKRKINLWCDTLQNDNQMLMYSLTTDCEMKIFSFSMQILWRVVCVCVISCAYFFFGVFMLLMRKMCAVSRFSLEFITVFSLSLCVSYFLWALNFMLF